jgi:diketogulonate reductase-like aldo/keto reductase
VGFLTVHSSFLLSSADDEVSFIEIFIFKMIRGDNGKIENVGVRNFSAKQMREADRIHANGETVFAIPGASKIPHAEENVKAMRFTLTQEEMEMIDNISKEILKWSK